MIVISGALVLVSLVLLVLGVTQSDINLVYGCIVVSLVSLVFLILGIVQRRGEVLPGAAGPASGVPDAAVPQPRTSDAQNDDPAEDQASVDQGDVPVPGEASEGDGDAHGGAASDVPPAEEPPAEEGGVAGAVAVAGSVLVVANRPRYHVEGCRHLTGMQAQEVDLLDAREAGFTPCGVCKPDAQLARTGGEASPALHELPGAEPAASASLSATSNSGRTASRRGGAAPNEPEHEAPAATAAVASGTGGAAPLAAEEHVVVVPDRNRYHRAQCRHVRDAVGAETLSTAQAGQQGYSACGVCKP